MRGKVIAITGAARGIGLATARLLRERGATVVIGDIDEIELRRAAKELHVAVPWPVSVFHGSALAPFRFKRLIGRLLGADRAFMTANSAARAHHSRRLPESTAAQRVPRHTRTTEGNP